MCNTKGLKQILGHLGLPIIGVPLLSHKEDLAA